MKISLNWVKKYTDIDVSTEELVKLATERLGGIEGVTDLSRYYEGIVVAKVVSCVKHPNADKLSLCKIDDGGAVKDVARDENGYVQVVCGAPNVREGILVAWIPPQAVVPASYGEKELFVLEARELRGELSNGMLASPAELGMSDDHDGILEIDPAEKTTSKRHSEPVEESTQISPQGRDDGVIKPGTPFKNLYDLDDAILEIENKMFTHRPDGFGHLGVAREIAGIQHKAFTSPQWYVKPQLPEGESGVAITIEDAELCPRYMAVEFKDVTIAPSPIWLQSYLKRVGIKPINNVVDVTNYIMMLTAQPLHAFDYDKVALPMSSSDLTRGSSNQLDSPIESENDSSVEIIVRKPKAGEKILLLDGKEIEPHSEATLICNQNGPIALGGVIGGGNSEIDENTTHVVLECATFNMYNVRKTSMIHGIFTDAATRLTKGQPAEQLPSVLTKAIAMFEEIVGASVVGGVADSYPLQKTNQAIEIEADFINKRLGSQFTDQEIITMLTNVEFKAHVASGPISVLPPFWRTDIEIKEDIVEEIGRMYGFNQLPITLPQRSISPAQPDEMRELKSQMRNTLARAGANEILSYSFVHGNLLKKAGQDPEKAFALRNALSPDLQHYRLSLLPSLLEKVHPNIKAGNDEFVLFEIGKTHSKDAVDSATGLPIEDNFLEMVYVGSGAGQGAAYYQMLRYVDDLLVDLGIPYKLQKVTEKVGVQYEQPFAADRSSRVHYKHAEQGGLVGIVGELELAVLKAFKLPEHTAAAVFTLDGAAFKKQHRNLNAYKPLSRYESSKQDITLQVSAEVSFADLQKLIEAELEQSEYDWTLSPLGVYQKEADETRNISFRITLSHQERTLITEEVTKLIEAISWKAHEVLGAQQI
jgi:phenylalanyl-tRNA synthetase beta chain